MAETAVAAPPARGRGSQRGKRIAGLVSAVALALGGAIVAPTAAQAAETPSFTTDVTEVANERIDIAIEGTGFGDVKQLPGQTEPHAYFTLVEKDADLSEISDTDTAISASVQPDGTVSDVLSVPAEELTEGTAYEVISWPSRSFPTEANLYARADVEIDWAALFPVEEPSYDPQLAATPDSDLDPAGDTVTVSGTGYDPAQAIYVFLCADIDLPADLWSHALTCRDGAKVVYPSTETDESRVTFDADGSFELEFGVRELDGATAVFTAANHTAPANRVQDAKASLAFAAAEPEPATPSFTAEATEVPNERVDIAIEGSGYDDVSALPGQTEPHAYFTLVEKGVDLGEVSDTDTAISATVAEDGTVSDVLSVPAEELVEGTEYEVISWPSRSFPTEANLYARADVEIDWTALFPGDDETADDSGADATDEGSADDAGDDSGADATDDGAADDATDEGAADDAGDDSGADAADEGSADDAGDDSGADAADEGSADDATDDATDEGSADDAGDDSGADATDEGATDDSAADATDEGGAEDGEPEEQPVVIQDADGNAVASVTQGDDVVFSVGPVETGTAFDVTIHSDPITLPEQSIAGDDGIATAVWSVPADFETGEHTVVFDSGDLVFSSTFEVLAAEADDAPGAGETAEDAGAAADGSGDAGEDTGASEGGDRGGAGAGDRSPADKGLAPTGGSTAGTSLLVAGVVMALGAGLLVIRRRVLANAEG
ncbi:hypothetical protein [Microbacterium sp. gxy059]|uniref:hypothetical protein n=1 Tax=Microbacterium sp. gxy059 TaxID=2957199 RepID=UPI003D989DEB